MLNHVSYSAENNGISRRNIRCVIRYEGCLYVIYRDWDNQNVLMRVKYNFYQGFKQNSEIVQGRICRLADKLMELHAADCARYPMKGEWYEIGAHSENSKIRWSVRKVKPAHVTTRIYALSLLLHFLAAMALTVPVICMTYSMGRDWLHVLLPDLDRTVLGYLYAGGTCAGCTLLFILFKTRRTLIGLFYNSIIPFGIVVAAGLLKQYWWMWIVIPVGACIAYVVSIFLIAYMGPDEHERGERVRSTLIVCGLAFFCVTAIFGVRGYSHIGHTNDWTDLTQEQVQAQHVTLCTSLDSEIWDTLDVKKRLEILQAVCDYECLYVLGCEPVRINAGITSEKDTLGEYDNSEKSILISAQHVKNDSSIDVLNTVLHETRHAYQYALVEMYISVETHVDDAHQSLIPFREAQEYYREFNDYCPPKKDYEKYYGQEVEKDSRAWARKRIEEYYVDFVYPDW